MDWTEYCLQNPDCGSGLENLWPLIVVLALVAFVYNLTH